jgi:hypothetical protein
MGGAWCAALIGEPAMSTRALYTFKGETAADSWNVYKHHDGYPTGAAQVLQAALAYAWELPRYEPDEFAAAFCAAGKAETKGGGVRFMPQGTPLKVASKHCSDIEFRYEIFADVRPGDLRIRAYAVSAWDKPTETLLFECALSDFAVRAAAHEEESD